MTPPSTTSRAAALAAFLFFSSMISGANFASASPFDRSIHHITNTLFTTSRPQSVTPPASSPKALPFASVASPHGQPRFVDAHHQNDIETILKQSLQSHSQCICNISLPFNLFRYIYSNFVKSPISNNKINVSYKNPLCTYNSARCHFHHFTEIISCAVDRYDFTEKLLSLSEHFLATPYVLDALGEGDGADDSDPLMRFDVVDCMTFVETTLAMALSTTPHEVERHLTQIRYAQGNALFENRHHFFTAQWAPEQINRGLIRDITQQIGKPLKSAQPPLAISHKKITTDDQWNLRKNGRHFQLPPNRQPIGEFNFNYIPIQYIMDIQDRLPSGAIFALVREDRPLTPFMVTHIGFVVRHSGKVWLRHAGRDLYGQVIDEELHHYVRRASQYKKWVVLGMRFFEILPPNTHCGKTIH